MKFTFCSTIQNVSPLTVKRNPLQEAVARNCVRSILKKYVSECSLVKLRNTVVQFCLSRFPVISSGYVLIDPLVLKITFVENSLNLESDLIHTPKFFPAKLALSLAEKWHGTCRHDPLSASRFSGVVMNRTGFLMDSQSSAAPALSAKYTLGFNTNITF